jgi:hypothetical protein
VSVRRMIKITTRTWHSQMMMKCVRMQLRCGNSAIVATRMVHWNRVGSWVVESKRWVRLNGMSKDGHMIGCRIRGYILCWRLEWLEWCKYRYRWRW